MYIIATVYTDGSKVYDDMSNSTWNELYSKYILSHKQVIQVYCVLGRKWWNFE